LVRVAVDNVDHREQGSYQGKVSLDAALDGRAAVAKTVGDALWRQLDIAARGARSLVDGLLRFLALG
jgi:hypothetical protein